MRIPYTEVFAHSVVGSIKNPHDGKNHHLEDGSGSQKIAKALHRNKIPRKTMKEVREENRSRNAWIARDVVVFVPAVWNVRVQRSVKRRRNEEELIPVPVVH